MGVRPQGGHTGFSLLEMLFAVTILLVALVAVAQLIPASIMLNYRNRMDSSALVFAQRELNQFLDQPLNVNAFTDADGNFCILGDPAQPNVLLPNADTVITFAGQPAIDFSQSPTIGYNFTSLPDASNNSYELRWAVVPIGKGSTAYSKRFIIGARHLGGNGYLPPVTLDTLVSK
jgi:prepilin-type N-terminal cleavage/methylation domain-containing protein